MIEVAQHLNETEPMVFGVAASDFAGKTQRRVTLAEETYQNLTDGKATPTTCVEAALRFLIERESPNYL